MALTKIIATIGPASEKEKLLIELVNSGVSVFRLNLKHNLSSWHNTQIKKIKAISKKINKTIGLMLDLPASEKGDAKTTFLGYIRNLSKISISEVDFLATSFVKGREEIEMLRKSLNKKNLKAKIIAKIEAKDSLSNFKKILKVSDGILIARGDLAHQIPFKKIPYFQKIIIKECLKVGKPVIVATQFLSSMVENSFPTRAEISDVANAILDYADALMLSEETAIGKYPVKTVKIMEEICRFWELKREYPKNLEFQIKDQTSAVCYSAFHLYNSEFCQKRKPRAFLVLSRSGFTARMISRLRPKIPILVFTNQISVKDQLTLSFGVFPFFLNFQNIYQQRSPQEIKEILNLAKKNFQLKRGNTIIFLMAEDWKQFGRCNVLRIQELI